MKLPPGRTANNSDYLTIGRRYRFLFIKSQYINKPIRHLLYKKGNIEPNADDYNFLIPFYANNPSRSNTIMDNVKLLTSRLHISPTLSNHINLVHWIEPYNLIPNMFIPKKYRDIIPKDFIYITTDKGEVYVSPGSCQ